MKKYIALIFSIFLLIGNNVSFAKGNDQTPVVKPETHEAILLHQSYKIIVKNLKVELDHGIHTIDIVARWKFKSNVTDKEYVDSNLVIKDIKNFLLHYPSKNDFWEIINRKLSVFLLQKYPEFATLTLKLIVPSSKFDPYWHASIVTAKR